MFSFAIDKIWHSHILCSHLYFNLCLGVHGKMISHVAQVPANEECEQEGAICIACTSCRNCNAKCRDCNTCKVDDGVQADELPRDEQARQFDDVYWKAFGQKPDPAIWDLSVADGCASN